MIIYMYGARARMSNAFRALRRSQNEKREKNGGRPDKVFNRHKDT